MATSGQANAATGIYRSSTDATDAQAYINDQVRRNRMQRGQNTQQRQAVEGRDRLGASIAKADLTYRDKLNQNAEARAFDRFQTATGAGNPGSGGSGFGGGSGPASGNPQATEQAARDAAFARAKEQSAAIARSSLTGLRNNLSSRGISGGGYAQMQTAEALAPAADQLQDFTREQMIQDFGRAGEVADRDVAADLTRRGQDVARSNSLLGLLNAGRLY